MEAMLRALDEKKWKPSEAYYGGSCLLSKRFDAPLLDLLRRQIRNPEAWYAEDDNFGSDLASVKPLHELNDAGLVHYDNIDMQRQGVQCRVAPQFLLERSERDAENPQDGVLLKLINVLMKPRPTERLPKALEWMAPCVIELRGRCLREQSGYAEVVPSATWRNKTESPPPLVFRKMDESAEVSSAPLRWYDESRETENGPPAARDKQAELLGFGAPKLVLFDKPNYPGIGGFMDFFSDTAGRPARIFIQMKLYEATPVTEALVAEWYAKAWTQSNKLMETATSLEPKESRIAKGDHFVLLCCTKDLPQDVTLGTRELFVGPAELETMLSPFGKPMWSRVCWFHATDEAGQ